MKRSTHSCVVAACQCCLRLHLSRRPSCIALLLCSKYTSAAAALCKEQHHVTTSEGCVYYSCARSSWALMLPFKLQQLPFMMVPFAFQASIIAFRDGPLCLSGDLPFEHC